MIQRATNYISFSLWGQDPIYNIGVIRNAELAKTIYPNWEMIVFHDETVPQETIKSLQDLNVNLKNMSKSKMYGMFWRFLATEIPESNYVIFRDADSRIGQRERLAVDEWIQSGKTLHVMRDHPFHMIPCGNYELGILGGMWGIKSGNFSMLSNLKNIPYINQHRYGNDQTFLRSIYETFKNDKITHDEFFDGKPFPMPRDEKRFIGERIDINEKPLNNDCDLIENYQFKNLTQPNFRC